MDETHVIESCLVCQIKIRLLKEKAVSARCPKCKGPLGDPKIDQPCGGCGAVNRVLRSRLSQARCGRCKEPLLADGEVPKEVLVTEAHGLVGEILADAKLGARLPRPRDLVEVVDLLKGMPQAIAELAAAQPPGADRDRLATLSARCRALAPKLRSHCFASAGVLLNDGFVQHFMLEDAFEAMRAHPLGFEALKQIRRQDTGVTAARQEMAPAITLFEQLLNRLHKTSWEDLAAERQARLALADALFGELSKVVESWLLRPYKLEGMIKSGLARFGELNGGAEAIAKSEAAIKEDLAAFLALTTTVVARGVVHHKLGASPKEVWASLSAPLRGQAIASA